MLGMRRTNRSRCAKNRKRLCSNLNNLEVSIGSAPVVQAKTIICGNGHSSCLACGEAAHAPCACDKYASWSKKVDEEMKQVDGGRMIRLFVLVALLNDKLAAGSSNDVANALWLAANCKRCPRCQTPIEKDEGCNHMSCRKVA